MSTLPLAGLVSGDRTLSLDQLALRSRCAAAALAALGVRQGGRVALLLRNDFAYFEASQGAALLGASTVPLNWHLTPDEIVYILRDCEAQVCITHADLFTNEFEAAVVAAAVPVVLVRTPAELVQAYDLTPLAKRSDRADWDDLLEQAQPWQAAAVPIVGPMFYTSGTSGVPKGVQRAAGVPPEIAAAAQRRTLAAYGLLVQQDATPPRAVMTGPLYHSAPNAYGMNVLRSGGLLVLQPRFDAAELLDLIECYRISHLHMVPTMFVRLLQLPETQRRGRALDSLRHVAHGAAPCPPGVKRKMIDWWGPVIHEYYAMTETGIIALSNSAQWLAHPGSVGCAAPGVQIRIDDEAGRPLAAERAGEICIRSETTDFVSYHRAESKTQSLRRDGFLCTGDVGYLSPDGFLYISDRKSDMVISGGVNIYPAEIEAVLLQLAGVKDAAVFGIPDEVMGERVVAVVERRDGSLDSATLLAALRATLAGYKLPREIRFDLALPREDSGKVKKRLLRDLWLAQLSLQS